MLLVLTYNNYFNLGSIEFVIHQADWQPSMEYLQINNQYYVLSNAKSQSIMFGPRYFYPHEAGARYCQHPLEERAKKQ